MTTIEINSLKGPDGMIWLKLSPEQFDEIRYAVQILNKKREVSRELMRQRREQEKKNKVHGRTKMGLNIMQPVVSVEPNIPTQ
ncbi:MAG TPA: hypothetical protein PLS50_06255 [Candidatus Dojkabacteria bacterium]|nr:hypothetical protein [Candidatus Dojkabacteria bacterium]